MKRAGPSAFPRTAGSGGVSRPPMPRCLPELRQLRLAPGDRVLDVGGANGLLLDRLHARSRARGVCVDVAMRGLREVRARAVAARPVCADALGLPFPDATFAAALSFET